jgi:SAM-dependent methyltransferase
VNLQADPAQQYKGGTRALRKAVASKMAIQLALALRGLGLLAVEPLDLAVRLLNGKHLPPMHLRRYVGPLAGIESSAAEFTAYLKLLCGAKPTSRVLDVGCGFGLMGLSLKDFLRPPGSYLGIDISSRAVHWGQRNITSRANHFRFVHVDIQNDAYNRRGRESADTVLLPLSAGRFDIVLLKSVFTHMRPPAVANYLGQIASHLSEHGVCLATLFLLEGDERTGRGRASIDFRFGDDRWRYAYEGMPELAVAYPYQAFAAMAARADLRIQQVFSGSWSGTDESLSYQDIVLLGRAS